MHKGKTRRRLRRFGQICTVAIAALLGKTIADGVWYDWHPMVDADINPYSFPPGVKSKICNETLYVPCNKNAGLYAFPIDQDSEYHDCAFWWYVTADTMVQWNLIRGQSSEIIGTDDTLDWTAPVTPDQGTLSLEVEDDPNEYAEDPPPNNQYTATDSIGVKWVVPDTEDTSLKWDTDHTKCSVYYATPACEYLVHYGGAAAFGASYSLSECSGLDFSGYKVWEELEEIKNECQLSFPVMEAWVGGPLDENNEMTEGEKGYDKLIMFFGEYNFPPFSGLKCETIMDQTVKISPDGVVKVYVGHNDLVYEMWKYVPLVWTKGQAKLTRGDSESSWSQGTWPKGEYIGP